MSGGTFDYFQSRIEDIADSIQDVLDKQGTEKPLDYYCDREYYKKHPEERLYETYPIEVQDRFKEAVKAIRIAYIYAQRVDWLLSGDDGEETFIKRLKSDLEKIN